MKAGQRGRRRSQQIIPECGSFADEVFKSQLQEVNAMYLQPFRGLLMLS